jgi:hypothetical protein
MTSTSCAAAAGRAAAGTLCPDAVLVAQTRHHLAGPDAAKSGLAQVCAYLLGHWEPLTAHLRHSETRLDNNLVENAIRPSAIGKKNWFIGHPDAGQRSAINYSLVVSCQRHGKDPLPT